MEHVARERRQTRAGLGGGGGGWGWWWWWLAVGRPVGKRIAAREPPKLDYSCHAALNGVTHVRANCQRSGGVTWANDGTCSIWFHSLRGWTDEWRERFARFSREVSIYIETPPIARGCLITRNRRGDGEVSRRLIPLITPWRKRSLYILYTATHGDEGGDDHC